jgi:mycothiol synthase
VSDTPGERWCEPADDDTDRDAAADGLVPRRELLHLRRALPLDVSTDLPTRPFRPGVDDEAWLAVNNRAFAWHPDQGGWTLDTLRARFAEPWFDADGFLVHDIDDRLAGFCWTKVHRDEEPPVGEIYVIGVDPDHAGTGLGRALAIAGLDHLARYDRTPVGMLYVESDNEPALGLYRSLGFTTYRVRRQYVAA